MDKIDLAGLSMHRQNREATSGKTKGGGVCLFVSNSWCAMSNIKEVSMFCSPEVEYLMISCRPHYLPREFSSVFFKAVYIPPQTNAGTKTTLNELYKAISKQENAHSGDIMQANLNRFYLISTSMSHVKPRGKKTLDHLYSTHRDAYKALPCPPFGKSDHNYILLIPA